MTLNIYSQVIKNITSCYRYLKSKFQQHIFFHLLTRYFEKFELGKYLKYFKIIYYQKTSHIYTIYVDHIHPPLPPFNFPRTPHKSHIHFMPSFVKVIFYNHQTQLVVCDHHWCMDCLPEKMSSEVNVLHLGWYPQHSFPVILEFWLI